MKDAGFMSERPQLTMKDCARNERLVRPERLISLSERLL